MTKTYNPISRIRQQAVLALLALIVLILFAVASGWAQEPEPAPVTYNYFVLHAFGGRSDAAGPSGTLLRDSAANLYGVSSSGGSSTACTGGCGTVYKRTAKGIELVLYSFTGKADGAHPAGSLLRDASGNLYGTASSGGIDQFPCGAGCGTVFELSAAGILTVLHSFTGPAGADGSVPETGVIRDASGNLYGTTADGGTSTACLTIGCGTIFKLTPSGSETVLYSFTGGADGSHPEGGLLLDGAGNLYGVTGLGGSTNCGGVGCGTVFKLSPSGTLTTLHTFSGGDGEQPSGSLLRDAAGNLYGTTQLGGSTGRGVVFKLGSGGIETTLHTFKGIPHDGSNPTAGLIQDAAGNLYGTTTGGGSFGRGAIFMLSPGGILTLLHSLNGTSEGAGPETALIHDGGGNLYGTAVVQGPLGKGVLFKLSPQ